MNVKLLLINCSFFFFSMNIFATTYVMPEDFKVVCLDLKTGKTLWENKPGPLRRPKIYISRGIVIAEDPARRNRNLMDPIISTGREKYHRYVFDLKSGKSLDITSLPSDSPKPITPISPFITNLTAEDGTVFVFDQGNTRHLKIKNKDGKKEIIRYLPDFPFQLNVVNNLVLFTFAGGTSWMDTGGGIVYAYKFKSNHLAWKFDSSKYIKSLSENTWTGITVNKDRVYVSVDQVLFALNAQNGKIIWLTKLPRQRLGRHDSAWTTMAQKGNYLLLTCYNCFFCIDPKDGKILWKRPGGFLASPWPTISGDYLLLGVRKGPVTMLSTSSVYKEKAKFSWQKFFIRNLTCFHLILLCLPWGVSLIALWRNLKRKRAAFDGAERALKGKGVWIFLICLIAAGSIVAQVFSQLLVPFPFYLYLILLLLYLLLALSPIAITIKGGINLFRSRQT